MTSLSVRIPEDLEERLKQEARSSGASRSELARQAILEFVEHRERERFMAELVEEARRLRDDPEVLRVAEEFLSAENEALEIAEGAGAGAEEPWWD